MKVALLLTGLHYRDKIDFRFYVKNIKKYISELGEIDTFLFTNSSPISDQLQMYNPKYIEYLEDTPNRRISKTLRALEYILEYISNVEFADYECICITRFDIYFMRSIIVNPNELNVFSILEVNRSIDDNFYFFPVSIIHRLIKAYSSISINNIIGAHLIKPLLEPIHYIYNEKVCVRDLSSFKLRFFPVSFSMEYLYTDNIPYSYNQSTLTISGDIIHFKKPAGEYYSYFYYKLNAGTYNVTYQIKSNISISHFIQVDNLKYNNSFTIFKPTNVYFMFDTYTQELDIYFKNIQFIPFIHKNKLMTFR